MSEPTEKVLSKPEQPDAKTSGRKIRSPEQLAVLAKAREKALEIRKQNQAIRSKEIEIKKVEKENKINDIETKYQEVVMKPKEQVNLPKEEVNLPKIKVKQYIQSDSDDEDLVIVKIPKKKLVKYHKKASETFVPPPTPQIKRNPLFSI